jgi:hypothetical protein
MKVRRVGDVGSETSREVTSSVSTVQGGWGEELGVAPNVRKR